MINEIVDFFSSKTKTYMILLFAFSLLFAKSIFIHPFSLLPDFWGILLGAVLWAAVFSVCLLAVYFAGRIKWEYKKTDVKRARVLLYMIPPVALSSVLLLIYFPGIMSWDSMYIWDITQSNDYTNLHPVTYVLFVNLLNDIIDSPWIVIAVQYVYSAFVFAYTGYVLETIGLSRKVCWAVVFILSLYPVNAISNVTMLKDVPYMMSLVLLSIIILRVLTEKRFGIASAAAVAAVSLIAMFSRHNGLLSVPVALILLTVYFLVKKDRKFAVKAAAVLLAVLAIFFGANKIIEVSLGTRYWQRSSVPDLLMMPSAQLSYTIDKNWDSMNDTEKEEAGTYLDIGYISYQKENVENWEFNNRYLETLNMDGILNNKAGFIKFYFKTLRDYPLDMITEYGQMTGILWASPNYGYTRVRNYGIPKDYADIGLKKQYLFPKTAKFLDNLPKLYFLIRPALWFMLSLLLLFALKKGRRLMGFIIISPMLANAFGFLFGTPAQNVRYLYCNFSCFLILLIFSFMSNSGKENEISCLSKSVPDKQEKGAQ